MMLEQRRSRFPEGRQDGHVSRPVLLPPPLVTPPMRGIERRETSVRVWPPHGDQAARGLGTSPKMQKVLSLIGRRVATDTSVLITGEAGVGKGLVAHEIHRQSARRERGFVRIDCAGLTEDFFDNRSIADGVGAAGDPHRVPWDRFRSVDGGTLFLDNIDELSPLLQEKLLQLLRERESSWAGVERQRRVDFRLIAATHQDLAQLLDSGKLREDLCYLVNIIHIHVPPLRTRREDRPGPGSVTPPLSTGATPAGARIA